MSNFNSEFYDYSTVIPDFSFLAPNLIIAGADEAGRGPLAGPVVAAAVIMPTGEFIPGVADSKKLSERKREQLFEIIISNALSYSVGIADNKKIDEVNILNASREAFKLAVMGLEVKPDILIHDYITGLDVGVQAIPIVKGDDRFYVIAAASIVAKVTRDALMREYGEKYPEYGFCSHKGYGTKAHYAAIAEYGVTDIHRMSFLRNITGNSK